ncbi:7846_t:CDS:2 [Funneliformis caledonium]|uniref:Vacuolar fusion protein MON1 n=1 Tax=Funneliformis caledonium TaxID=1117310 RepID=A0A9N9ARK3_9GLOM|nr:7846_t:CDS:2 [Funneliformis caledonium]
MNFDLRILLGGIEPFLDKLANSMSDEPVFMLGSMANSKDLLYAMLITNYRLITLLRLKKHSLHSADLHLVFNIDSSTPTCAILPQQLTACDALQGIEAPYKVRVII